MQVNVSVELGVRNGSIILISGDGRCELNFWELIPSSMKDGGGGGSVPSSGQLLSPASFVYLALAAMALAAAAWLLAKRRRARQSARSGNRKLDGALPVSGWGHDGAAGWNDGWNGSWDDDDGDDEETPRTPSKPLPAPSLKRLAPRRSNRDSWKD